MWFADNFHVDFVLWQCLNECRKAVARALGVAELDLELSMGMSQDFEKAVSISFMCLCKTVKLLHVGMPVCVHACECMRVCNSFHCRNETVTLLNVNFIYL